MSPLLLNAPPSSAHCCPREDAEASPEASSTALEAARWQEPLSKPCLLLVPLGSPEPPHCVLCPWGVWCQAVAALHSSGEGVHVLAG